MAPVSAQTARTFPYDIRWELVRGAGGYILEVRDENESVVVTKTLGAAAVHELVQLRPGSYEFRLTTLNRFLRPEASTEWVGFVIKAPTPPVFVAVTPTALTTGARSVIVVRTTGLEPTARIAVEDPAGGIVQGTVRRPGRDEVRIELPALTLPGTYTLVLTNPPNLQTRVGALEVRYPSAQPVSLTPAVLPYSGMAAEVRIRGERFSPEAVVVLKGVSATAAGSGIELVPTVREPGLLTVSVPPDLPAGNYEVSVVNAVQSAPMGGLRLLVLPRTAPIARRAPAEAVIVPRERPSPAVVEASAAEDPPFDPADPGAPVAGPRWIEVGLGVSTLAMLGDWGGLYPDQGVGGLVFADYYPVAQPNPLPWGEWNWAVGGWASFAQWKATLEPSGVESEVQIVTGALSPSASWILPYLRLKLNAGLGLAYTKLTVGTISGGNDAFESLDWTFSTGLTAEVPLLYGWNLGLGGSYHHFFFADAPLDAWGLTALLGYSP